MISLMIRIRIATDRARQQFPAVIVSSHHGEKKDYITRKKQKAILRWKAIHPEAHRSYYFHICFIIRCRLEHCYTAHLLQSAMEGENSQQPPEEPYECPSEAYARSR